MILHATFEPDLELSAVMEDDSQMDAEAYAMPVMLAKAKGWYTRPP